MNERDRRLLRAAFGIAARSREKGNHPFGALLADDCGNVFIEAENTVVTERDCIGHSETNLIREACRRYDRGFMSRCTVYASTEPCPMCSGAISWANVGRVVFGLSQSGLRELAAGNEAGARPVLSCREILAGGCGVEVIGPALEEEARRVHEGFWTG